MNERPRTAAQELARGLGLLLVPFLLLALFLHVRRISEAGPWPRPAFFVNAALFTALSALTIVAHELGHGLAAAALGMRAFIQVGVGRLIALWPVGRHIVTVRATPIGGYVTAIPATRTALRMRLWLMTLAGPAVQAFVVAVAYVGFKDELLRPATWTELLDVPSPLLTLVGAQVLHLLNLLPFTIEGKELGLSQRQPSDGLQLLRLPFASAEELDETHAAHFLVDAAGSSAGDDHARALDTCDEGLALYPRNRRLRFARPFYATLLGRYAEARAWLLTELAEVADGGERAMLKNNIAWTALFLDEPGRREEAEQFSAEAWRAYPDVTSLKGTRGAALVTAGHAERGRSLLEEAHGEHPDPRNKALVAAWVAIACRVLGDEASAEKWLATARAHDPGCHVLAVAADAARWARVRAQPPLALTDDTPVPPEAVAPPPRSRWTRALVAAALCGGLAFGVFLGWFFDRARFRPVPLPAPPARVRANPSHHLPAAHALAVAWSRDGARLATTESQSGGLTLRRASDLAPIASVSCTLDARLVAFGPRPGELTVADHHEVVSLGEDGVVRARHRFREFGFPLAFSPDLAWVVAAHGLRVIVHAVDESAHSVHDTPAGVGCACFSPDGRTLAFAHGREAVLVSVLGGEPLARFPSSIRMEAVAVSARGVVATASGRYVQLWSAKGEKLRAMELEWGHGLAFSPTGAEVAAVGLYGIGRWRVADGAPLTELAQQPGVASMSYSPDGRRFATVDHKGELRVWTLPD